jgi:CheY-like chemotaxis protein
VRRIALVEDNPDNRLLARAILEELYEIDEYETGPDALVGMQADPPELVLLDISLPAMDGTEVLRRMREDEALRSSTSACCSARSSVCCSAAPERRELAQ